MTVDAITIPTMKRYTTPDIYSIQERYTMPEENETLPEWITTTEAAEVTGLERDTIAEYCRRYERGEDDRLICKKMGRDWWVSSESALSLQKTNRGRPRKDDTNQM